MSDDIFQDFDLPDPPAGGLAKTGADLDQSDIDALFGDVGAPPPARTGLRALIESDVVNHERLPVLEVICDRVIRSFATDMRNLTSDAIEVSIEENSSARFGEAMNRTPLPAMFGVFRIAEWEGHGVIVFEPNLIYSVVDALLGGRKGSGGAPRIEGRAFTTIETALVSRVMQLALDDLAAAFDSLAHIHIELERVETSPRFAAIAGPSNVTAVCGFRVEMEGRGGRFSILMPHTTLEPVREKLVQRFMGEKAGRDDIWERHLEQELRKTVLKLDAVIVDQMMRFDDVHALTVGQTLRLNRHPDAPLTLQCAGVPLVQAQIGRRNDQIAARLNGDIARI